MADKIKYPTISFVTDEGRLVEGSLSKMSDVGYQNKKLDKPQAYFALAVPKTSPTVGNIITGIMNHAWNSSAQLPIARQRMQSYPIGSPPPAIEGQKPPYAWKIDDGDNVKRRDREGQAGCWIFKFTSTFAIPVADCYNKPMDPDLTKLGQYARVAFSVAINGLQDDQAGIFLNVQFVRIERDGPLIISGPSAESLFGAPVAQPMPAGIAGGGWTPPAAGQPAPAVYTPPPVPAPQPAPVAQQEPTAEQIAAYYQVQHHPGWRYNHETRGYEQDPLPVPAAPAAAPQMVNPSTPTFTPGMGSGAATGAFHNPNAGGFPLPGASGPAVPAGAMPNAAPFTGQPGSTGTASPSNGGFGPGNPPTGFAPHPAFLTGQR